MARSLLTRRVEIIGDAIDSLAVTQAAGDAMHDAMLDATERYLGADLRMSGFGGDAVRFPVRASRGEARLVLAGSTYAIADKGRKRGGGRIRHKGRKRKGVRKAPLSTPWGPRQYVKRSSWEGFSITDRHAQAAIADGIKAALDEVDRQVRRGG